MNIFRERKLLTKLDEVYSLDSKVPLDDVACQKSLRCIVKGRTVLEIKSKKSFNHLIKSYGSITMHFKGH